jgi:flagellar biosynthesis protein FlhF
MFWVKSVLARNLNTWPTKTNCWKTAACSRWSAPPAWARPPPAKLAARCVMRHGSGKLALITTDGYRIGGYEQLRIYGKILGVMVHSVKDETDLRIALEELKGKHTVLIDRRRQPARPDGDRAGRRWPVPAWTSSACCA